MPFAKGHLDALHDALNDMQQRALSSSEYEHLSKTDRRLLDQFAYRYTEALTQALESWTLAQQAALVGRGPCRPD